MPSRFESDPAATLRTTTSIDDLDLPDELLAHVEASHEMAGNVTLPSNVNMLGNTIVDDALAVDRPPFFCALNAVASSFEILDQRTGSGPRTGSWPCLRRFGGGESRLSASTNGIGKEWAL